MASQEVEVNESDVLSALKDPNSSHDQFMSSFRLKIAQIIERDPCLRGLPTDITLQELEDILAVEEGRAVSLYLRRFDDVIVPVTVLQGAAVSDLKLAIKRAISLKHKREGGTQTINWKYIWRTYWIAFKNQRLTNDREKLVTYGLKNKDEITFIKQLRREDKVKNPRRNTQKYRNFQ